MDWSKSKSIFIVVFLILDVFLYSLYLNRHTEAQKVPILGEKNIEARLKDDNITYGVLPANIEKASYISGKVKNFQNEKVQLQNVQNATIEDSNKLVVQLRESVKIPETLEGVNFSEFLKQYVYNGTSYSLWKVDEENRQATFFQSVNNRTIYYNINGVLTIYWNEDNEIVMYEQTILEKIEEYDEEETLLTPVQVFQALYSKGLLKPDSRIMEMKLGYSTLVQLTQTQVFVPTWEVQVKTADENIEEYFVNAVEGKVIDVQLDSSKVEEVENEEALEAEEVKEAKEVLKEVDIE
jgi:regulatory protein YycI of two-component signal transduction system YycFG